MMYAITQNAVLVLAAFALVLSFLPVSPAESAGQGSAPPRESLERWLAAVAVAAFCVAAAIRVSNAPRILWLDDLYTLNLLSAGSLRKLLQGIITGIDGNPPEYLTLSWIQTHWIPAGWWEPVLRWTNAILMGLSGAVLYSISRRFVPAWIAIASLIIFYSWNDDAYAAAVGLRTYALFFLVHALSLLLAIRAVEQRSGGSWIVLGASLVALVLAHTFGITYVACIAMGLFALATVRADSGLALGAVAALAPALAAFALWVPFMLIQGQTAKPYGWPWWPGFWNLVDQIGVIAISAALAVAAIKIRFRPAESVPRAVVQGDPRLVLLLCIGLSEIALSVAVWVFSKYEFPVFVSRYMVPRIVWEYAALVAALVAISGSVRWKPGLFAGAAAAVAYSLVGLASAPRAAFHEWVPCLNPEHTAFLEDGVDTGGEPIIVESPDAWLPRRTYAHNEYIFPLDWDVVLKYPLRNKTNAVDYNIMLRFRNWANAGGIITTDQIRARYRSFYVLQELKHAWLINYVQTGRSFSSAMELQPIRATSECRLWHVTVNK